MGIPLRLLLVEDSEDDAILLARELSKGPFDVSYERVETEETIRKAIKSNKWDLIITDHNLPTMDSKQCLSMVKSMDSDIPIIVVSGCIGEDVAVEAMKSGAHDYIMKGNLQRLLPAVTREIREAESRRARRRAEETIHHMAFHDALTGLANRHEFEHRLQNALMSAKEYEISHAVLYLDLDQFKIINDTCGHIAGDELLRRLAREFRRHVREGDTLARLGGDEFGVLLEHCNGEQAQKVSEGLLKAVQALDFEWQKQVVAISVSIGQVEIDATAKDVTEILQKADIACFTAKDLGRNRSYQYRTDDEELARRHGEMQWVTRINHALSNNRFFLAYQKIFSLKQKTPQMYEFLLRFHDENNKVVSPSAFIPAAERYNLMAGIDRWVVNEVFQFVAKESQSGGRFLPECCFINLSGNSLSDDGFFSYIREKLEQYQIDPSLICFEITETATISRLNSAVSFIKDIKNIGAKFALDDFGSGLSSFSYLKTIPVDYLKIDGGFVINMLEDHMDCAFVDVINQLGHVAGLKTIAEFVENEAVHNKLKEMGVDFAQGYGLHQPEPIASLYPIAESIA